MAFVTISIQIDDHLGTYICLQNPYMSSRQIIPYNYIQGFSNLTRYTNRQH